MRHWPEVADPVLRELPTDEARLALTRRRDAIARAVARLPAHHEFLANVLGR